MNLENVEVLPPLRVLFVNPLTPAARFSIVKILSGVVFGLNQIVELILVVYSDEIKQASALVYAMEKCAFSCYKSIKVSTAMPTVEDADVFVFDTTFANPNIFDFKHEHSNENFDSLYLLVKVANNLVMPKRDIQEDIVSKAANSNQTKRKPIFVCDGLVAMDILHTFSTNVPSNCFFCPTTVPALAKSLLGDHLKIPGNKLGSIHVFGANDQEFYFEFERPLIPEDDTVGGTCGCDVVSEKLMATFDLDYAQFNPYWLRNEYVEKEGLWSGCKPLGELNQSEGVIFDILISKNTTFLCTELNEISPFSITFGRKHCHDMQIKSLCAKNLYGPIFKSTRYKNLLGALWRARANKSQVPFHRSVGVISDGSFDTIKGLPYIFPLAFYGEDWKINTLFEDNVCVQAELKKYNKIVQDNHRKLILLCTQFYEKHLLASRDHNTSSDSTLHSQSM